MQDRLLDKAHKERFLQPSLLSIDSRLMITVRGCFVEYLFTTHRGREIKAF